MRLPLAIALCLAATPALAQFPPPGVYVCMNRAGTNYGELTLLVAGDYSFTTPYGVAAAGQVASAGTDVNPLSGPLQQMGWTGAFGSDEMGHTIFRFLDPAQQLIICMPVLG